MGFPTPLRGALARRSTAPSYSEDVQRRFQRAIHFLPGTVRMSGPSGTTSSCGVLVEGNTLRVHRGRNQQRFDCVLRGELHVSHDQMFRKARTLSTLFADPDGSHARGHDSGRAGPRVFRSCWYRAHPAGTATPLGPRAAPSPLAATLWCGIVGLFAACRPFDRHGTPRADTAASVLHRWIRHLLPAGNLTIATLQFALAMSPVRAGRITGSGLQLTSATIPDQAVGRHCRRCRRRARWPERGPQRSGESSDPLAHLTIRHKPDSIREVLLHARCQATTHPESRPNP